MHSLGLRAAGFHFVGLLSYHTKPHWTRCSASASRPKVQHPKALGPGADTPLALQKMAQQTKPNSSTPKQAFCVLESFFRMFLHHCSHLNSFIILLSFTTNNGSLIKLSSKPKFPLRKSLLRSEYINRKN